VTRLLTRVVDGFRRQDHLPFTHEDLTALWLARDALEALDGTVFALGARSLLEKVGPVGVGLRVPVCQNPTREAVRVARRDAVVERRRVARRTSGSSPRARSAGSRPASVSG